MGGPVGGWGGEQQMGGPVGGWGGEQQMGPVGGWGVGWRAADGGSSWRVGWRDWLWRAEECSRWGVQLVGGVERPAGGSSALSGGGRRPKGETVHMAQTRCVFFVLFWGGETRWPRLV